MANKKKTQDKSYLAKDFSSFRSDLVNYARNYFIDQNADFSEASLGGMFVELAAYVGDSMSFFLDHQFNELDPATAIQTDNILAHARNAGVKFVGASPASTDVDIYIEVPAQQNAEGNYEPLASSLPVIREGSAMNSTQGVIFTTTEDLDFGEKNYDGTYNASIQTSVVDNSGNPTKFIMRKKVGAVSGQVFVEQLRVGAARAFRTYTLTQANVSEIISIRDKDRNDYYEVDFLTQNSSFKKTKNISSDQLEVPAVLNVVNASRRYVRNVNYSTALTTITFGGGEQDLPDNDIVPDPAELALPLYGRQTFQRFSIDPQNLLRTKTLGVAPANTTLTITYRAGGGLNHNVPAGGISGFSSVNISFPKNPSAVVSSQVFNSLDARNEKPASGGSQKPTIAEIRDQIFSARNQQSRIVSTDDLLARLYTLPPVFGRIYRAVAQKSSRNPLATELYILCKNASGQLAPASDTLKRNLRTYLNEFRLISDAIDVLDATVINYGIEYSIVVTPDSNKQAVLAAVANSLAEISRIENYQLNQPLVEADLINAIINTDGVLSLQKLEVFNKPYGGYAYDMQSNKFKGMYVGPAGSIFEMKNPASDIIGSAE